jgi:hypothetical protein
MTRLSRFIARGVVLALAVGAGLAIAAAPARASNFGSIACAIDPFGEVRTCVSLANNNVHAVRVGGYGLDEIPFLPYAHDNVIAYELDPTDLHAYLDPADPVPDVWVMDRNYGPGVAAWTECPTNNSGSGGTHPNFWCRGQVVRYNAFFYLSMTGFYDNPQQVETIVCHELGHTVGLRHPADTFDPSTCMGAPGQGRPTTYSAHDVAHINSRY